MKYALLALCIALSGCSLSYEETQTLANYCTARGLQVQYVKLNDDVTNVRCKDAQGNSYQARRQ